MDQNTVEPGLVLRDAEAAVLAHPLVSHVAETAGLRALSIKGPIASLHGLRPERVSADADILVDPLQAEALVTALAERGWHERPMADLPRVLELHSVTLIRDDWPTDLDIHHYFPGLLADPSAAFEALWRRRQLLPVAGLPVSAADRLGTALILALHPLRDPAHAKAASDYAAMLAALDGTLSDAERDDLIALATETGTEETLAPFWQHLGLTIDAVRPETDPALRAWRLRTDQGWSSTAAWMLRLKAAPLSRRPAILWQAIVLPERDLRLLHPEIPPGWWALQRARTARLRRGVRTWRSARTVIATPAIAPAADSGEAS